MQLRRLLNPEDRDRWYELSGLDRHLIRLRNRKKNEVRKTLELARVLHVPPMFRKEKRQSA